MLFLGLLLIFSIAYLVCKRLLTTAGLNGEKMIKLGSPGLCQSVKAMEEKSAASQDMGMEAT
jgi:hypothetical protein